MKKSLDIYKILHGIPEVHILFLSRELSIFITEKKRGHADGKRHVACEYRRFSLAAPRGEQQRETVVLAGYNA